MKNNDDKIIYTQRREKTTFPIDSTKDNIVINANKSLEFSNKKVLNQAFILHSKGDFLKASKYYQYLINKGVKDPKVFSRYAILLKDLRKFKEAELMLLKAIELKPDYAEAHFLLGNLLAYLGKFNEAEIAMIKTLKLKPDYVVAHYCLGRIFKDLGKFKEAEISIRKAIELKADFAEAHSNLGDILTKLGKLDFAILSYKNALSLKKRFYEASYGLGKALFRNGKYLEGLEKIKECQGYIKFDLNEGMSINYENREI